jgi:SAM-dependent methyltransferase
LLGRFWILASASSTRSASTCPSAVAFSIWAAAWAVFPLLRERTARPALEGFVAIHAASPGSGGRKLGLGNVRYEEGDVMDFRAGESFDAAYMLDIVHHIPEEAVRPLLEQVAKILPPGGRLLIKDVDRRPAYKRWFTHALDKVMDPGTPVRYWEAEELTRLLEEVGFTVHRHLMVDVLPYPHILYICERRP